MQSVSALYQQIYDGEHFVEAKVVISGVEYSKANIVSLSTENALYDEFSIGNVSSREINLELWGVSSIPRMAYIEPYVRVVSATSQSEWLPKSKFFVDTREYDPDSDTLVIRGFDAMLKADAVFFESGTWSPQTAKAIVQTIAGDIGVSIEAGTLTELTNTTYIIQSIPSMGNDGTTSREMLSYIGVMYGGNWIIDDSGELKLVGLVDIPAETYYLITSAGNPITFGGVRILVG